MYRLTITFSLIWSLSSFASSGVVHAGAGLGAGAGSELPTMEPKQHKGTRQPYRSKIVQINPSSMPINPQGIHRIALPYPQRYQELVPSHMFQGADPIPPAIPTSRKDIKLNFFKGPRGESNIIKRKRYENFASTFFNFPIKQYKPEFQQKITLLRGEIHRRPEMYRSTYRNIMALHMQAQSAPGEVSMERSGEYIFFEEGLSSNERERLLNEIQGPRMPLHKGLRYGARNIAPVMKQIIEFTQARIQEVQRKVSHLKTYSKSFGGVGHEVFDAGRNYAVYTMIIIEEGKVYVAPLRPFFSSNITPINAPGPSFHHDIQNDLFSLIIPTFDQEGKNVVSKKSKDQIYYFDGTAGSILDRVQMLHEKNKEYRKRARSKSQEARKARKEVKTLTSYIKKTLKKQIKKLKKTPNSGDAIAKLEAEIEKKTKEAEAAKRIAESLEKDSKAARNNAATAEELYQKAVDARDHYIDQKTASLYQASHAAFPHSTAHYFNQSDIMEGGLGATVKPVSQEEKKSLSESDIKKLEKRRADEAIPSLKYELSLAYTHSEQAMLQYLKRTKWRENVIFEFLKSNPNAKIQGVIGVYGTLRDACTNCAKAIALDGDLDFYVAHGRGKKKIPYGAIIAGFGKYKQQALTGKGYGEKTSREPSMAPAQHMDLKERSFSIYAG